MKTVSFNQLRLSLKGKQNPSNTSSRRGSTQKVIRVTPATFSSKTGNARIRKK